jgi:hypothetical protein
MLKLAKGAARSVLGSPFRGRSVTFTDRKKQDNRTACRYTTGENMEDVDVGYNQGHTCEDCGKELKYRDFYVYVHLGGAPYGEAPCVCEDCADESAGSYRHGKD